MAKEIILVLSNEEFQSVIQGKTQKLARAKFLKEADNVYVCRKDYQVIQYSFTPRIFTGHITTLYFEHKYCLNMSESRFKQITNNHYAYVIEIINWSKLPVEIPLSELKISIPVSYKTLSEKQQEKIRIFHLINQ